MNQDYKILLLDDRYDVAKLDSQKLHDYQAIICLFWLAPTTRATIQTLKDIPIFSLQDIIISEMTWGKQAYETAYQIFTRGSLYAGLPLRSYLAEPLCREALPPNLIIKILEIIKGLQESWDGRRLKLEGYLHKLHLDLFARELARNPTLIFKGTCLNQEQISTNNSSQINRLLSKLQEAKATKDWRSPLMNLLESLDKTYHYRCFWGSKQKRPAISRGGITFFSSYQNNSRILSAFVDLMPLPVTWLLTNYSACKGIGNTRQKIHWIWQFFKDRGPQARTAYAAGHDTLEASSLGLHYLQDTSTWKNWQRVECLLLMNLTRSWEAYLDEAKPRLIVMASQWGIYGWLTQLARRRGIAVLQVMHGVVGGYLYTQTPILSDAMIAPGEFWKNLWPADQRHKILPFNPPGYFQQVERTLKRGPRNLTFFSWPLALVPYYNFFEITDGFIRIFHKLLAGTDIEITVRAHPLENPCDFTTRWNDLYGPLPSRLKIVKDEPLEATLKRTDLALMYRSTVMLNCLANGIPVIMPGWIDYGWNEDLHRLSSCYLAQDFRDLEERLKLWVNCLPYAPEVSASSFIRPAGVGQDEFNGLMKDLLFIEPLEGGHNRR